MSRTFSQKVNEYVKEIPVGSVRTYGEVATACGSPQAARAVGQIMAKNFNPDIPCHRVVRTDGTVGSYNRGGPTIKQTKLAEEGVMMPVT